MKSSIKRSEIKYEKTLAGGHSFSVRIRAKVETTNGQRAMLQYDVLAQGNPDFPKDAVENILIGGLRQIGVEVLS